MVYVTDEPLTGLRAKLGLERQMQVFRLFAIVVFALQGPLVAIGEESVLAPCPIGDDPNTPNQNVYRHNCQCKVRYNSGVYIGEFQNNMRNGQGTFLYSDGSKYVGEFKNDQRGGHGVYTFPSREKYVGEFKDGKFHGKGAWYGADGAVIVSGTWADGKFLDRVSPTKKVGADGQDSVKMTEEGGQYYLPIKINKTVTVNAILDTGASNVVIPPEIFSSLDSYHTIARDDFLGKAILILADGSKRLGARFRIRTLEVGSKKVENVSAIVGPKDSKILLGQSFFAKFKSWSIDNKSHILYLE